MVVSPNSFRTAIVNLMSTKTIVILGVIGVAAFMVFRACTRDPVCDSFGYDSTACEVHKQYGDPPYK